MMQPATITADAATPFTATGKIKPKKGTYLRATASNSGKKLKKLKKRLSCSPGGTPIAGYPGRKTGPRSVYTP